MPIDGPLMNPSKIFGKSINLPINFCNIDCPRSTASFKLLVDVWKRKINNNHSCHCWSSVWCHYNQRESGLSRRLYRHDAQLDRLSILKKKYRWKTFSISNSLRFSKRKQHFDIDALIFHPTTKSLSIGDAAVSRSSSSSFPFWTWKSFSLNCRKVIFRSMKWSISLFHVI